MADSIAGLFAPAPAGAALPSSVRVGRILSFDADDGSNTVAVGSATLTDLPMLSTGAEIGLSAGDNVVLQLVGNQVLIMGKVAEVGGSNYGASGTGRVSAERNATSFGANATGYTVLSTISVPVPGWAHSADILAYGMARLHNNSGSTDALTSQVIAHCPGVTPDGFAFGPLVGVATAQWAGTTACYAYLQEVAPGATMTLTFEIVTNANTWPTDANASASFFARVLFYRESAVVL